MIVVFDCITAQGEQHGVTLVRVEFHLPCVSPLVEEIKVMLESCDVFCCGDSSINQAIISKETDV